MSRFFVNEFQWIGAFIGDKPFGPAAVPGIDANYWCPKDSLVTVQVHVSADYGEEGPWEVLKLVVCPAYCEPYVALEFLPSDGAVTCSLQPGNGDYVTAHDTQVHLLAACGQTEHYFGYAGIVWARTPASCPYIPTSPANGCGSGGATLSSPDQNGNSLLSYSFGGGSDPHGLGASAVFGTQSASWSFAALPGDVSVVNQGQTAESTPRNCIHATVPAGDGTSRLYCSDSATGDFVPAGSYGTSFAWNGSGYVETIGDSQVHYDSSGVLQRVVSGQSEHIYSCGTGWVDITANTATPTKHRYNLQGDNVQSIVEYAQLPGSGWTEARRLEVGWSGSQVTSFTSYPGVRTTSFSYIDGSLASYEDCSGRAWNLQYEEE